MSAAKKTGNVFAWMIIVALVVGLGGFGVTNFGGSAQGIGSVGETTISLQGYFRTLRNALQNVEAQTGNRLSLPEAETLGLVQSARAEVVTAATLEEEMRRLGVSIGDEPVRQALLEIGAFQGQDGGFDREAYRFTLQQNGLSEAEFEEQVRADTTRSLIETAIAAATRAPETYETVLTDYFGARRSYTVAQLDAEQLENPVGAPDAAALQSYYEANAAQFTVPESRDITYAWLTPEMLRDQVELDDEVLRALYDERIEEFVQPERRLVEQLNFPDQAAADAARARLDAGEASFEELAAARDLELSQVDLGDVTQAQLGDAGAAVFALQEPGVVGPLQTGLGPALIRMNAVLAGSEISFEQARPDLARELALDRASRQISDMISDFDDQLAAGATLEELANDTQLQLGQIAYHPGVDSDIAAYDAFRTAAAQAQEGDFPELAELEDGGIFALRVNGVTPPRLHPLDEVRDAAVAGWQAEATTQALQAQAEALKATLDAGLDFETLGVDFQRIDAVTRAGVAAPALAEQVFALAPGDSAVVTDQGTVQVVQVNQALPPDAEDASVQQLRELLAQQGNSSLAGDIFVHFTQARLSAAGLSLDEAAIRAVHAQLP